MKIQIITDEKYIFLPFKIDGIKTKNIERQVITNDIIVFMPFFLQNKTSNIKNAEIIIISESVL